MKGETVSSQPSKQKQKLSLGPFSVEKPKLNTLVASRISWNSFAHFFNRLSLLSTCHVSDTVLEE